MKQAEILAFWAGEVAPDTRSHIIQTVLGRNYSHNGFIYLKTGMLWHSTFSEDENDPANGVCEQTVHDGLKDCIIRAKKKIVLNVNEVWFEQWLEMERGKPYAHRQNTAVIFNWFQPYADNGDQERNCSEFLAAAAEMGGYKFPRSKDYIKPTDTFRVIKPTRCSEVVDSNWRLVV